MTAAAENWGKPDCSHSYVCSKGQRIWYGAVHGVCSFAAAVICTITHLLIFRLLLLLLLLLLLFFASSPIHAVTPAVSSAGLCPIPAQYKYSELNWQTGIRSVSCNQGPSAWWLYIKWMVSVTVQKTGCSQMWSPTGCQKL